MAQLEKAAGSDLKVRVLEPAAYIRQKIKLWLSIKPFIKPQPAVSPSLEKGKKPVNMYLYYFPWGRLQFPAGQSIYVVVFAFYKTSVLPQIYQDQEVQVLGHQDSTF